MACPVPSHSAQSILSVLVVGSLVGVVVDNKNFGGIDVGLVVVGQRFGNFVVTEVGVWMR